MKAWIAISIVVFLALVALIYIRVRAIYDRVEFDAWYDSVSLKDLSWSDIKEAKGTIRVNFLVKVLNANDISIRIKDLRTKVYYQGKLVGETPAYAARNITLGAAKYQEWIEPVDIYINKGDVKVAIQELISGRDPQIDFKVSMKIYGIRYSYIDHIKLIEELT